MKFDRDLTLLFIALMLVGFVVGVAVFIGVIWRGDTDSALADIGVLTPATIGVDGQIKQVAKVGEVEIWSDESDLDLPDNQVLNLAIQLLETEERLFWNQRNDNMGRVRLVNLSKTGIGDITEQATQNDGVYLQPDVAIYSGDTVYLPSEMDAISANPDRIVDNILAGLGYATVFNNYYGDDSTLELQDGDSYNTDLASVLAEYFSNIPIDDFDVWQAPYPQKISEYEELSEICFEIASYVHLHLCEFALYQNGTEDLIPPRQYGFFENNGINPNTAFRALDRLAPGAGATQIASLGLAESTIKFNNWGFSDLGEIDFILDNNLYYREVSAEQIEGIADLLVEELGFEEAGGETGLTDNEFEADSSYRLYRKTTAIGEITASIRALDTKTLNADCIVEGVGELFCTEDAILKDSGYFVQIIFAERIGHAQP